MIELILAGIGAAVLVVVIAYIAMAFAIAYRWH